MIRAALTIAIALAASPLAARDPLLGWPLDCQLGQDCFIQNYRDDDPGPGVADYTCGPLSYDGHKGTDISLNDMAAMRAGARVLAAAPGQVRAVRDGEPDDGSVTPGKECGNGVVINHGGGWESQYCHMKRGSITVAPGQHVAMGTPLGQVGYSGQTQFPHLHFELRKDGAAVDPFNKQAVQVCNDALLQGLWLEPPKYQPGGLITAGMALEVPEYAAIKDGLGNVDTADPDAPALVLWAYAFGAQQGDVLRLTIRTPDGGLLTRRDVEIPRNQARMFHAAGKRRPPGGWAPGRYQGTSQLLRDGAAIGPQITRDILISR